VSDDLERAYLLHIEKDATSHVFQSLQLFLVFDIFALVAYITMNQNIQAVLYTVEIAFVLPYFTVIYAEVRQRAGRRAGAKRQQDIAYNYISNRPSRSRLSLPPPLARHFASRPHLAVSDLPQVLQAVARAVVRLPRECPDDPILCALG